MKIKIENELVKAIDFVRTSLGASLDIVLFVSTEAIVEQQWLLVEKKNALIWIRVAVKKVISILRKIFLERFLFFRLRAYARDYVIL